MACKSSDGKTRRISGVKAWLGLVILLSVFASDAGAQTKPKANRAEQTRFGLEEPINHPVPIPEGVLKILRQDSDISACDLEPNSRDSIPSTWYEASQIHLDGPNQIDFIVKAKNACLWGANIGPFWVFRGTSNGHSLVLSTAALGLRVLNTKTNGLRDVEAGAVVSLKPSFVTYRFDGQRYQQSESNSDRAKQN